MTKLTLHHRLFISHLLSVLLGLLGFYTISHVSARYLFSLHLTDLEDSGVLLSSASADLMQRFASVWSYSNLLSMGMGVAIAALLSYWIARRVNLSLIEVEQVAYQLANGHLNVEVPISPIPELARLGRSLSQMVAALLDAEQRRGDMITDLSHELRSPLTVVRGYLEEMESSGLSPTPDTRRRLVNETKRLERLVNNLQELSKAESGSLQVNHEALSVPPLLAALVDKFSMQLMPEGPTLEMQTQPNLPSVWADGDRLEQILVNLLGNAIRYTERGSILLKAWSDRDSSGHKRIWMAVSDTGMGLSASEVPHVFERFWRSAASRSQNSGGTGIGLTITRQLVELQGGQIFVESQPGVGTTFKFWLPAA